MTDTPTGHSIRTDRPCARCGFNLFNQPIVREPHYGLLAARCPECGQLAALQEYPLLGRWADRWAKLIAGSWVAVLVAAIMCQFGPTMGFSLGAVDTAAEELSHHVGASYLAWVTETKGEQAPPPYSPGNMAWTLIDVSWWEEHGPAALASFAGRRGPTDFRLVWFALPLFVIAGAGGVFWSTCLLGARRRVAFLVACIPSIIALCFAYGVSAVDLGGMVTYARDVARAEMRTPTLAAAAGVLLLGTAFGAWQGRRLSRLAVTIALPPRMCSALGILWTRDGLPMPSARPGSR